MDERELHHDAITARLGRARNADCGPKMERKLLLAQPTAKDAVKGERGRSAMASPGREATSKRPSQAVVAGLTRACGAGTQHAPVGCSRGRGGFDG